MVAITIITTITTNIINVITFCRSREVIFNPATRVLKDTDLGIFISQDEGSLISALSVPFEGPKPKKKESGKSSSHSSSTASSTTCSSSFSSSSCSTAISSSSFLLSLSSFSSFVLSHFLQKNLPEKVFAVQFIHNPKVFPKRRQLLSQL